MNNFFKKGITVAELLVVVAVIGFFALIILPKFSQIRENSVLKSAIDDVLSSIDKAKNETLSSLNSSEYGVHFQSYQVIIFKGKVFSAGASDNESISITTPASISSISLTGGVSDMYFNRLYNAPSVTGTITISTPSFSKIITIYPTGVVSSN
jgi:Tfp pilus assembly protein FimT